VPTNAETRDIDYPQYGVNADLNATPAFEALVRQEFARATAELRAEIDQVRALTRQASADARTQRLREIAIDTAIRTAQTSRIGSNLADTVEILKAAAHYFAFLDTGATGAAP
jgi:hypothetical protein